MALEGTLGFLGYGNMGTAILEGLLRKEVLTVDRVTVYDPAPERSAAAERLGATLAASAKDLARASDTVVIAVKPQIMEKALASLRPGLRPGVRAISIAAISIAYLRKRLGKDVCIVRVMPNTPVRVGVGAVGIALSDNCTEEDGNVAKAMFEATGIAEMVTEETMDIVTALSGSGPAYFFYLAESLVKAAVAEGLDEATATRLAKQTLVGAGRLMELSDEPAGVLRRNVTTKGGTTEAAITQFRADGFEDLISAGVHAATERSRELCSK